MDKRDRKILELEKRVTFLEQNLRNVIKFLKKKENLINDYQRQTLINLITDAHLNKNIELKRIANLTKDRYEAAFNYYCEKAEEYEINKIYNDIAFYYNSLND